METMCVCQAEEHHDWAVSSFDLMMAQRVIIIACEMEANLIVIMSEIVKKAMCLRHLQVLSEDMLHD
jgi:hypothetical protein